MRFQHEARNYIIPADSPATRRAIRSLDIDSSAHRRQTEHSRALPANVVLDDATRAYAIPGTDITIKLLDAVRKTVHGRARNAACLVIRGSGVPRMRPNLSARNALVIEAGERRFRILCKSASPANGHGEPISASLRISEPNGLEKKLKNKTD